MQYRFTQNLGSDDAKVWGLDLKECVQDAVVNVPKETAELISAKYPALLEPADKLRAVAKEPAIAGVPEESPVHDEGAREAIADIGNMRSKDKLQHVIDNDKRPTVVKAAKDRLATL